MIKLEEISAGYGKKQVLYGVSAVLGLIAVLLAGPGALVRTVCAICAFIIALVVWLYVFWRNPNLHHRRDDSKTEQK